MNSLRSCQPSQLSAVMLAICATTSIGCQSMGKLNLLADKQIPVLTRDTDVELPPPSAAETPSPVMAETNNAPVTPSSFAATTEPTSNEPATADGHYPATSYGTFPQQPESRQQSAAVTANTFPPSSAESPMVTQSKPSNFASPSATAGLPQNVQQGPYATKAAPIEQTPPGSFPSPATTVTPATGAITNTAAENSSDFPVATNAVAPSVPAVAPQTQSASTALSNNSSWPISTAASSSPPVAQTQLTQTQLTQTQLAPTPTTPAPNNVGTPAMMTTAPTTTAGSDRGSSFGSNLSAVTTPNNQLTSGTTLATPTGLTGTSPPASQIPAYVAGNQSNQTVAQASYETAATSHYEQVATQPASNGGGWRPGSTGRR